MQSSHEVLIGGEELWHSDKNTGAVKDPEIMSRKVRSTKDTLINNDFTEYKLLEESDGSVSVRIRDRTSGLHLLRFFAFLVLTIAAATAVSVIFQVTLHRVNTETRLTSIPLFFYGSLQESLMEKEPNDYTARVRIRESYALLPNLTVKQTQIHGISFIQDIVLLPDEILFLVRLPSANSKLVSHKLSLSCSFLPEINTPVNGIDYLQFGSSTQPRAAVRCQPPPPDTHWSATSVALVGTSNYSSHLPEIIAAKLGYIEHSSPIKWDYMVYESFSTDRDIVLFAKGINHRQGLNVEPRYLRCIFNNTIETMVTLSAQEIFRCEHPNEPVRYHLIASKITLAIRGKSIPSVAYYEIPPTYDLNKTSQDDAQITKLCACTMVFNVAKYIREWVIYNSHLGVQHFFLYDNNSEDNLEETLAGLFSEKYKINRLPWPWAKTQESGFSHCALMAKDKCQWMMYTDVDEFVFSPSWLNQLKPKANLEYPLMNTTSRTALWQLVTKLSTGRKPGAAMTGQISLRCRNFGPSGLHEHPEKGVTQGYTCRERQEKRYKSILLLEAASPSLLNVIHRFQLTKGYRTAYLNASKAVINHYKYQAWSEFKAKFRRRVSAYVVDWKESRNPRSQDRTPGLGNRAIKPHGWENMFCQVNDTALKEYANRVFSLNDEEEAGSNLVWQ
jgi:hypothetical protein